MMDGRMRQTTGKREIEEKAAKRKNLNSVLSCRPQDKTPAYVLSSDRLLSYHLLKKGLISVKV